VGRMEAKRLVVRVPGETDRREVHVRLTPRGNRILRALTVIHREELRRAAPALVSSLRKVCERTELTAAEAGSKIGLKRPRFVPVPRP
jgi:DNA-binding MarR family transcriptional regulator